MKYHVRNTMTKPSGVSWLGNLPDSWTLRPLFALLTERKTRNSNGIAKNILSLSYGRVVTRATEDNYGLLPASFDTYQEVEPGDIIMRLTDLQNDQKSLRVGLVQCPGIITSAYVCLRGNAETLPRFIYYLLHSYDLTKVFYRFGGGVRQSMVYDDLRRLPLAIPPRNEQHHIVAFLDRETAHIDKLIRNKERLVALLEDKQRSLANRIVTQGIEPSAAMKPSGISWMGEIPEHWEVKPLKYIARVGNGSTPNRENASYWSSGTFPWLNSSVVNQEDVIEPTELVTDMALKECHLPRITPPAILVGITGQGRTRGMATTLRIEATINQHIVFVKPKDDQSDIDYLRRVFDKAYTYLRDESGGSGSTKGAITCEQISNLRVPIPPVAEQVVIARELDYSAHRTKLMVAKVRLTVERLREYRSALITAAVTGKIDVR